MPNLRGPGGLPSKVAASSIVAGPVPVSPADRMEQFGAFEMGGGGGGGRAVRSGKGIGLRDWVKNIANARWTSGGSKKPKPKPERKPGKRQEAATTAKDLGIEVKSRDTAATINQKIEAHRAAESAKVKREGLQTETASAGARQREGVLSGRNVPVRSAVGTVHQRTQPPKPEIPQVTFTSKVFGPKPMLPAPKVETPKPPATPTGPKGPKDQPRTPDVIQLPTKKPADTSGPYTPGAGPKGKLGKVDATGEKVIRQKEARAEHKKRMEEAKSSGFNQLSSRYPDARKPAAPHLQGRGVKPTFTQQAGIAMRSAAGKIAKGPKAIAKTVKTGAKTVKENPIPFAILGLPAAVLVDTVVRTELGGWSNLLPFEPQAQSKAPKPKAQPKPQPKPQAQPKPKAPVIQSTTKKPVQIKKSTAVASTPKNYPSFTPPTGAAIPGVPGMVMDRVFSDASLVQSGRSKTSKTKVSKPKSVRGFTPNTNDMLKRKGKKPQAKLSLPSNYGGLAGQAGEVGKHAFAAPVQLTSHVFGGIEAGAGALRKLLGG